MMPDEEIYDYYEVFEQSWLSHTVLYAGWEVSSWLDKPMHLVDKVLLRPLARLRKKDDEHYLGLCTNVTLFLYHQQESRRTTLATTEKMYNRPRS